MHRRDFLTTLAAPAALAAAGATRAKAREPKPKTPPNIILILGDDVGREVLGCYGGTSYKTPRLDALAKAGVRFDHAYTAPVCHPTRVCLLSGKYPSHLGNPGWGSYPKKAEAHTLAAYLKKAGYATAVAGKWQLTLLKKDPQQPHRMGFDHYCLFGWHEGPRYWQPLIWQDGRIRPGLEKAYGPDVYTKFLIDFMKQNRKRPFFAFYSMALCHAVSDDFKPRPPHGPQGRYETYAEMVAEMDVRIGQIVDAAKDLGLADNTLILYVGDNGTPGSSYIRHEGLKMIKGPRIVSQANGLAVPGQKGRFTDGGIRVPMLAAWPARTKPGQTNDTLVDMSDLLPTFLELAGQKPPDGIDGRSFAGLLTAGPHTPREWICVQARKTTCIRTRHWKLISSGKLYDMANDADETKPIPPAKDTPESKAARARLTRWMDPLAGRAGKQR